MSVVRDPSRRHAGAQARLLRLTGVLVAALLITGTALAADVPKAETEAKDDRPRGLKLRLDRDRLVPRVSIEMESLASFHRAAVPGQGLRDHVLFEEMSDAVRRGAKRATRKAVRNYLLEAVNLDRGIDRVREGIRGKPSAKRDIDWHVGIHSMLPEIGMRYRLNHGSVRFVVGAEGDAGIKFKDNRFERAEFSAVFDGDDTFYVRARLGF
jgi:hypothetical protein